MAELGHVVVDTSDAAHEAGDLLQADLPAHEVVVQGAVRSAEHDATANCAAGPVLFKSCGWAGWNLAAAGLAREW